MSNERLKGSLVPEGDGPATPEEFSIEELLHYEPASPEAWRQHEVGAQAVGEGLANFNSRLNATTERIEANETLTPHHKADLYKRMAGIFTAHESPGESSKLPETPENLHEAVQSLRVNRLQQAGVILGRTTKALLKAPDQFVQQCLAPLIASGGKQLKDLTQISTEAAEPILLFVKETIERLGKAGATATGAALEAIVGDTGRGLGKFVRYVGEGMGPALKSIIAGALEGVGEGAGKGVGAFARDGGQGVGEGAGRLVGALPAGVFKGFRTALG